MKNTFCLSLLTFYFFGTFSLPVGDFSMLNDLTEMYGYCKAPEVIDMVPLGFITVHLVNIDDLFDKHENGDKHKSIINFIKSN